MEELIVPDCIDNGGGNSQPGSWPNLQETLQFERAASAIMADQQQQHVGPGNGQQQQQQQQGQQRRPHTISAGYGQPQSRPPLNAYHFSPPPSSPAPDGQVMGYSFIFFTFADLKFCRLTTKGHHLVQTEDRLCLNGVHHLRDLNDLLS
jgi:hypothetical protein